MNTQLRKILEQRTSDGFYGVSVGFGQSIYVKDTTLPYPSKRKKTAVKKPKPARQYAPTVPLGRQNIYIDTIIGKYAENVNYSLRHSEMVIKITENNFLRMIKEIHKVSNVPFPSRLFSRFVGSDKVKNYSKQLVLNIIEGIVTDKGGLPITLHNTKGNYFLGYI